MERETNITVIDSLMGTGKTSYAIQYMNEASESESFIYITPLLSEIDRIQGAVENRDFEAPSVKGNSGRKMDDLKRLLTMGADIATTHSLFQAADGEVIELLKDGGYTLILDETMDVVEPVSVKKADIEKLIRSGDIRIEDGHRVIWTGDANDDSRYADIRIMAQAGNLYCHRDTFFAWAFPPNVFSAIDNVIVLTYLFKGSILRYYFDMFGFEYKFKAVNCNEDRRYELVEYDASKEDRLRLFSLMSIYEGRKNDIGNRGNTFSSTWLRNADLEKLKEIRNNLYGFFQNDCGAKKSEVYYSTLNELEKTIAPKGYKQTSSGTQVVIPLNCRATNDFADRKYIAYLYNRYLNPNVKGFFQDRGVTVDEDLYAVGDLLQWIFRSQIRNGEPIKMYIPNSRMRGLLIDWAKGRI
ncbi:hypothetical protein ACH0B5_07260 [Ureibacillus sp. 179-F W5.1 NHS]|uniref:hypothetical protein n=1 Tax=Ureibacillus sp. 179-F W5.1 NHS TaxID=3374297 RepID=UPI00387935B8